MTPLARKLADEIRALGPIGVDRFMDLSASDPVHGYYRTRDPLGSAGDFITAPEISQVFGEIIGAWMAERWQAMGEPDPVMLVELGPGRGTLMADLLRAISRLPAARAAIRVHLVETSLPLRDRQRMTLATRHPELRPAWHDRLDTVPEGPLLLVANEFFDALPIRQWIGGTERRIGLDAADRLEFVASDDPGAVVETCEPAQEIAIAIGRRLACHNGAALVIDYGHDRTGSGETLQAVRDHRYAPVLDAPGEADITAHVDFQALGRALANGGAAVWGPVSQGRFLLENGAGLREEALCRGRTAEETTAIRRAVRRLIDPAAMGRLFKVMAAGSPGATRPAGF